MCVMAQVANSKVARADSSQDEHTHASAKTTTVAQKREALKEELRVTMAEGHALQTRMKLLDIAEKTTSVTRDASLAIGSGIATVVAGPAGGAAFRAGIGSLSHAAEHGIGNLIDAPNTQSLATHLKGDIVEGAVSYVGGAAAMKVAAAATRTLGAMAVTTTTSKLLAAEAAGVATTTVNNAYNLGTKALHGHEFSRKDAQEIAANYVASVLSAGISSKIPVTPRLSTANAAEAIAGASIAAGQQYITEGHISPDAVLVAALQNVTSAAAVAKRATHDLPTMKEASHPSHAPLHAPTLTVKGVPGDEISSALHHHVATWRNNAHEWSPLQRWTFEEAEKRGLQIEVVHNKGTASRGKVEVSLDETYHAPEIAIENARRGLYNSLTEHTLGKAPDLSSPSAVYLHRLCEELAVTSPHLERARFEMLKRHGASLSDMGLAHLNHRTSGDLRSLVHELRRLGHPEQADFYKECLTRAGIDVELEGANRGVKIPVYGLADGAVLDQLRHSLAEWRSNIPDQTPLTKWVMERAENHKVEVIVIKRGSHAYDGTRVGVALDDIRPSQGAAEIARHELWHAVSSQEFFDKVDPKKLYRKEPSSLYLDEVIAHLVAGRTLQDAHTHVMHNYEPTLSQMQWPETYARLNGDLKLILDQVGEKVSPQHREFYRHALSMAGVEIK